MKSKKTNSVRKSTKNYNSFLLNSETCDPSFSFLASSNYSFTTVSTKVSETLSSELSSFPRYDSFYSFSISSASSVAPSVALCHDDIAFTWTSSLCYPSFFLFSKRWFISSWYSSSFNNTSWFHFSWIWYFTVSLLYLSFLSFFTFSAS